MTVEEAVEEMEMLLATARVEGRELSQDEQRRFTQCRAATLPASSEPVKPSAPTRPVVGGRSLSRAIAADGFVARLIAGGRARTEFPMDIRALASNQAGDAAPGIAVAPAALGVISTEYGIINRLLLAMGSIPFGATNAVQYTRLRFAQDVGSPSVTGNAAAKVEELQLKPQAQLESEDVVQPLATWAQWLPTSRQILEDQSGLRALLDLTLISGVMDVVDRGIMAELTTVGNFTTFAPQAGEKVGDAIARIASAMLIAGATGVRVALNPATYLAATLAKATGSGVYIGLPVDIPARIVPSASVPAGKLLAWADTGAVWGERSGVTVEAGLNNDDFTRNKVTLLCECRGNTLVFNPAHVMFGNATA